MPVLKNNEFYNSKFIRNSDAFKSEADVIISNSNTEALADVAAKVYTHNLFGSDS
jgi:UDPglucose 6-dehydrogenase